MLRLSISPYLYSPITHSSSSTTFPPFISSLSLPLFKPLRSGRKRFFCNCMSRRSSSLRCCTHLPNSVWQTLTMSAKGCSSHGWLHSVLGDQRKKRREKSGQCSVVVCIIYASYYLKHGNYWLFFLLSSVSVSLISVSVSLISVSVCLSLPPSLSPPLSYCWNGYFCVHYTVLM